MLNLNYTSRKYFAGQLRTILPSPNTEPRKDLYSLIKSELKEVKFAFLLINVLDLHVFPFCDMNTFMES